jgi:hypothetical protein
MILAFADRLLIRCLFQDTALKASPGGDAKEVGQRMPAEETCATRTKSNTEKNRKSFNRKLLRFSFVGSVLIWFFQRLPHNGHSVISKARYLISRGRLSKITCF